MILMDISLCIVRRMFQFYDEAITFSSGRSLFQSKKRTCPWKKMKKTWWRFHTKMRERANNVTRPIYQSLLTMGLNGCRLTFDGGLKKRFVWKMSSFERLSQQQKTFGSLCKNQVKPAFLPWTLWLEEISRKLTPYNLSLLVLKISSLCWWIYSRTKDVWNLWARFP